MAHLFEVPSIQTLRQNPVKAAVMLTIQVNAEHRTATLIQCHPPLTQREGEDDSPEIRINHRLATAMAQWNEPLCGGTYEVHFTLRHGITCVSFPDDHSLTTRSFLINVLLLIISNLVCELGNTLRQWPSDQEILEELEGSYQMAIAYRIRTKKDLLPVGVMSLFFLHDHSILQNAERLMELLCERTLMDHCQSPPATHPADRQQADHLARAREAIQHDNVLMGLFFLRTHPFFDQIAYAFQWHVNDLFRQHETQIRDRVRKNIFDRMQHSGQHAQRVIDALQDSEPVPPTPEPSIPEPA